MADKKLSPEGKAIRNRIRENNKKLDQAIARASDRGDTDFQRRAEQMTGKNQGSGTQS